MASLPLHLAVLDRLASQVVVRLDAHRIKVGNGLVDQEYQRHVGRIAEAATLLNEINDLRKRLITDSDSFDEDPIPETTRVKARRNRRS